jgi:hypothetical protein
VGDLVRCRDCGGSWEDGVVTAVRGGVVRVKRHSEDEDDIWGEVEPITEASPPPRTKQPSDPATAAAAAERAEAVGDVLVEGQAAGEPAHGMMGLYALARPVSLVNDRPTYRAEHGRGGFLYYSNEGTWAVSVSREDMLAGDAPPYLFSRETEALTPADVAPGGWRAADGPWAVAEVPAVRAAQCGAAQRAQAEAEAAARVAGALAAAAAVGDVVLSSEQVRRAGTCAQLLGRYRLQGGGAAVAERAVWRQEAGDGWLYYARACQQWFVGDEADMRLGATRGWMYVPSEAELPPTGPGQGVWRVSISGRQESSGQMFIDTPDAAARPSQ